MAAYVGVVAARHEGRPAVQFVVAPDAAESRFYPMLLLPLVQRAMRVAQRESGRVPERVELVIKRHGAELGVLLRIEAGGLCSDDPELARVRERLAGLYAGRAEMRCHGQSGCSEFVLRVPL
jgi:LytS/YehU family sensor histidine kinase